jgi:hypothetical protein
MVETNLNLSGIELAFEGLPPSFERLMAQEWKPFLAGDVRDPVLRARIEVDDPAETKAPFDPRSMTLRIADGAGEFSLPGGHAWLERDGSVRLRLDSAGRESFFNMTNMLLACLATRLPARGGAVVHAGCLLVKERAYLLIGTEGAGKSTWTHLGHQGGAAAVSDDIVLVQGSEVLGSPFRSRHLPGSLKVGRWPIAALLYPHHGTSASRTPASRLLASARLVANLPFISAAVEQDPDVTAFTDRLVTSTPCYEFTFSRDPSFLALLD